MSIFTRRDILLAVLAATPDPFGDALDDFAQVYNKFIEQLRKGKFDRKLWQECEKKWRRLSPCSVVK